MADDSSNILPILPPMEVPPADNDDEVQVAPPPRTTLLGDKERWPQMVTLMRDYEDTVLKILRAIDELQVTAEPNASDSNNIKGNKWVRLQDHLFGGREDGTRGLITEFPVIILPSKLKKKILSIWTFGCAPEKVCVDIHRACVRQLKEYDDCKKSIADSNKAEKDKHAQLVEEMRNYEDNVGALPPGAKAALPPGAKPNDGGGRMNHSTNLNTRKPASFAYANETPNFRSPSPSAASSGAGSTAVNTSALKELNDMGGSFREMMSRMLPAGQQSTPSPSDLTVATNKKRKSLEQRIYQHTQKRKEFMAQLEYLEPRKETDMSWYLELNNKYSKVSRELVAMMEEMDEVVANEEESY